MNPFPPPPISATPRMQRMLPGPLAVLANGCCLVASYVVDHWDECVDTGDEILLWQVARSRIDDWRAIVAKHPHDGLMFDVFYDGRRVSLVLDVLPPNRQEWVL